MIKPDTSIVERIVDSLGGEILLTPEIRQKEMECGFVFVSKGMTTSLRETQRLADIAYGKSVSKYVAKHHPEWREVTRQITGRKY